MSCAFELSKKGKKVLVIEKQSYVGGRTSSFDDNGMAVESGLHRYIGYYSALPKLLKKCGVRIDDIVTWEDKVDILIKGESNKLVLGLAPLLAPIKTVRGLLGNSDALSVSDKLSMIPFFVCGFASYPFSLSLDKYSVAEYANRHNVSERAKRLVLEPLSSGIFFLPPENYSAYAFFGLFAPAIAKFYKMRIGAFLGGMTDVMCNPIKKEIERLGSRFVMNEQIKQVIVDSGAVVGVEGENHQRYYAPQTIIAVNLFAAKKILSPLKSNPALEKLFSLKTMSACTLQLELDAPALEKDITTFGPSTDAVSFAEQSRTTFRNTKGRLSVILGNANEYAQKSTDEILKIVVKDLKSLSVNLEGHIKNARKVCEHHEFYSLDKGSQRFRPNQKTSIKGLTLAGDYTLTSSFATMEGAVKSGKAAAKTVLKALKRNSAQNNF